MNHAVITEAPMAVWTPSLSKVLLRGSQLPSFMMIAMFTGLIVFVWVSHHGGAVLLAYDTKEA